MSKKDYLILSARNGRHCAVKFLNSATGKYMPAVSLGTSNKKEAQKIVIDWLKNGIPDKGKIQELEARDYVFNLIKRDSFTLEQADEVLKLLKLRGFLSEDVQLKNASTPLLKDYVSEFWDFEKSLYVKEKKLQGEKIGFSHCKSMIQLARKHAFPVLGDKHLSELSVEKINAFLLSCQDKGLASRTINNISVSIVKPLKFAYEKKIIKEDFNISLYRFSLPGRERGILTREETARLFAVEWKDKKSYLASLLASQTGARLGEIQALRKDDIGLDRLFIRHSWSDIEGLKSTKTGESRVVPLMPEMREALLDLVDSDSNPWRNSENPFIFWSAKPSIPIHRHTLNDAFKEALSQIGIDEAERKERNIVFHSWRHYVATYLANNVKKRTGMGITGHKDERTFDGYSDHEVDTDFDEKMEALKGLVNYKPPQQKREKIKFS